MFGKFPGPSQEGWVELGFVNLSLVYVAIDASCCRLDWIRKFRVFHVEKLGSVLVFSVPYLTFTPRDVRYRIRHRKFELLHCCSSAGRYRGDNERLFSSCHAVSRLEDWVLRL